MKEEMTSLERVMYTIHHQEPDRVPVWVQGPCPRIIGRTIPEFCLNPEVQAKAQIKLWEYCGTDVIKLVPDVFFDSSAWGTKVKWDELSTELPGAIEYGVKAPEDWEKLEVQDPKRDGRLPFQLRAADIAVRRTKNKVPICAAVYSVLTWASHVRKLDDLGVDMLTAPDLLKKGLETITETAIEYVKCLSETGIHMIYYNVNRASAELMTWEQYEEFGVPYDLRVLKVIRKEGIKVFLHSCGAEPYIYKLAEVECVEGAGDTINWWDRGGRSATIKEAKEKIGDKVCLCAGIDQVSTIMSSPEAVEVEAKDAIEQGMQGGGFWLGVGCFIAGNVSYENIRAISRAAKKYGNYLKRYE
jgi:uroporphyrinogen decarboxylase